MCTVRVAFSSCVVDQDWISKVYILRHSFWNSTYLWITRNNSPVMPNKCTTAGCKSGSSWHNVAKEEAVASTLLCFMVKSVAGKFRDVVAILCCCHAYCCKAVRMLQGSVDSPSLSRHHRCRDKCRQHFNQPEIFYSTPVQRNFDN